jgi:aspartyl aminopeptidase
MMMMPDDFRATARDMLQFIDASPTAAHAVAEACRRLESAGFRRLQETDAWQLAPGGRYYVVRHHHSVIAAIIGRKPLPAAGFRIAGAHTDAPGLRLKPNTPYAANGYIQLGVEVYGGPLLASWTDRDLTLAGKLHVKDAAGGLRAVLVRGNRPMCRIPQLAIHFNREVNDKGLVLNKQQHLPPICGLGTKETLDPRRALTLLAEQVGIAASDVVAADLEVVDTQPAVFGGLDEEFIFAPRIDNLAGTHAVLAALLRVSEPPASTCVAALFDSEEIGSQTLAGAASLFLDATLERIVLRGQASREDWHRSLARSLLVSVDGAHAVHPNFADLHDPQHRPVLNGGPVIKTNAQQRYATTPETARWFEQCAARAEVPVQHYVHRTDLTCGSTIGPMTATRLGVPATDVGSPMLSMHSIREMGGVTDQEHMVRALREHFVG